jgi:Protein of unknown function (DUF3703)
MNRARALLLIEREMAAYRTAKGNRDSAAAWAALARAHIISQPFLGPHIANHWSMLCFASEQRDWREVAGQMFRLALAPLGALTGRIPVGNTGRSNVSAFLPMPIADDLRRAMEVISE